MAENKKSVIEEALLEAKKIEDFLKESSKEILRSTMNEEINKVVKESISEDDEMGYEEEDVENPKAGEEEMPEMPDAEMGGEEGEVEAPEAPEELEAPEDGEVELDLTAASDDEVISVFKKLSNEDEVEVVSDKEVHITDPESGNEYHVKMGGSEMAVEDSMGGEMSNEYKMKGESKENSKDTVSEAEEILYEIILDEEVSEEVKSESEAATESVAEEKANEEVTEEKANESEVTEEKTNETEHKKEGEDESVEESGVRALNNGRNQSLKPDNFPDERRGGRTESTEATDKLLKEAEEAVKKYNDILKEVQGYKKKNEEYKKALGVLKTKLMETAVFNSNLASVTRLFMGFSTTKDEKVEIIKRFDEVSTLKESKQLYKTIAKELGSKKPVTESVEDKINKTVKSTGSSKELTESTAYVDESTKRIKDLITRIENKEKF